MDNQSNKNNNQNNNLQNTPNNNGKKWGYASAAEDPETGKITLIYTRINSKGQVNQFADNGDGGHSHAKWEKKEDFDAGNPPDYIREESSNSKNPSIGDVQKSDGCYLTTACMHHYKQNFNDNCHELTVLRRFRDKYITPEEKQHYYAVAPLIVRGINQSGKQDKYYSFIYNRIIAECVRAIEAGDFQFAYNRYKRTIQLLENEFVAIRNKDINTRQG